MPNWCENNLVINDLLPNERSVVVKSLEEGNFLETFLPTPEGDDNDWYAHHTDVWGTKWDICDSDVSTDDESVVAFFNTAWSPPINGIVAISEQFPHATFRVRYNEPGVAYCGVAEVTNGDLTDHYTDYSDIPGMDELDMDEDDAYEKMDELIDNWLNQFD